MDFRDTPDTAAFREEVKSWIRNDLTEEERGRGGPFGRPSEESWERIRSVRRKMAQRGWAAPAWPREYGGMGATVRQQAVFNEELAYHRVPGPDFIGINYVGPTLMLYGSDEQKREHLPAILAGNEAWCQGYSEPGAGSDLASLQTRAVREGDHYVINGQKIWTSGAHRADWMFMLARTDPDAPKHRGISYFILPMSSPGVEVRPLINMAGTHEFNEVFFSDVQVPASQLIGEENRGWYVGMATLDFERSAIGSVAGTRRDLEDLVEALGRRPGKVSATARIELADRHIEAQAVRMLSMRVLWMQEQQTVPNHEASMAKLFTTELNQRVARTAMKLLGMDGLGVVPQGTLGPVNEQYTHRFLRTVANTIEGGTSEIQRNIIATRGLGLPRG